MLAFPIISEGAAILAGGGEGHQVVADAHEVQPRLGQRLLLHGLRPPVILERPLAALHLLKAQREHENDKDHEPHSLISPLK